MTGKRILCVSNDPSTVQTLRSDLAGSSDRIAVSRSRTAALAALSRYEFDVVVIDSGTVSGVAILIEAVESRDDVVPYLLWNRGDAAVIAPVDELVAIQDGTFRHYDVRTDPEDDAEAATGEMAHLEGTTPDGDGSTDSFEEAQGSLGAADDAEANDSEADEVDDESASGDDLDEVAAEGANVEEVAAEEANVEADEAVGESERRDEVDDTGTDSDNVASDESTPPAHSRADAPGSVEFESVESEPSNGEPSTGSNPLTGSQFRAKPVVEPAESGERSESHDERSPTAGSSERSADSSTVGSDTTSGGRFDRLIDRIRCRLADAVDTARIETAIREELTAVDEIQFAWAGEYDRGERGIVPLVTDSKTKWPINQAFPIGAGEQPLVERALYAGEMQVDSPVEDGTPLVPLADIAHERNTAHVVVVPLETDVDLYGVLVLYAETELSPELLETIETVGDTLSIALEGVAIRGRLDQQQLALDRYERLVETAGDGMCVLDEGGHFTTVNDALLGMTGYAREALLGEHASVLFGTDAATRAIDLSKSLLETDENAESIEVTLYTKPGGKVPCEVKLAGLSSGDGYHGTVGVVRDITERKQRERRLQKQNERLDAFASIVSHDLRNPLGVAEGWVDLAIEDESTAELDRVVRALERMDSIITDVLTIARGDDWVEETDIVELESAATDAWESVTTPGATLEIDDDVTLEANRSQLLRMFENLFRNAIEHGMPESAPTDPDAIEDDTLTVRLGPLYSSRESLQISTDDGSPSVALNSVDADSDEAVFEGFYVEDDGEGMPEEIREQVFQAEFTTQDEGLGIGLWVVREVAEGHGWSVEATEGADGGARFEFRQD